MSKFEVTPTAISDVKVIKPRAFEDPRGYFMETYTRSELVPLGVDQVFVQDNQSLSRDIGTLRGLHYQLPPFAQDKLVRCIRGRIWDVAVDIRRSSPTFRQWVGVELSADNRLQLLVPVGFAHAFLTLEPDTEVVYKVSAGYSAAHDAGIRWDDPDIDIDWPLPSSQPVLSAKDGVLPALSDAIVFD
ncbi:dTDP-4-dehydrorhamnose 3,5-epimerase [Brevundimonas variabilis]|uniref:dTDP-4-dehydrorhamnose 3,5-epimerase n=1 Tax=Brevundimonas variabilis TaxID=74312 RepID=A0A7W9CH63_9CAUL|nr:dTDP-4-dehydrorhamnose 3,5-epimerase [Brevundimonas variabilis]MBB5745308.1 dTDP-4-dehydrorhamnose 3,5-epimerase [Brevundimonas variabilis]